MEPDSQGREVLQNLRLGVCVAERGKSKAITHFGSGGLDRGALVDFEVNREDLLKHTKGARGGHYGPLDFKEKKIQLVMEKPKVRLTHNG